MKMKNCANDRKRLTLIVAQAIGVAASLLAGCARSRSDGADPAVERISAALVQPQVASISVPAGVDFKPLALAASAALTVSDRAQLLGTAANSFAPSTSVGTSTSTYGSLVKVGSVTSLPAVTIGSSATVAGSITSASTITGAPSGTTALANQPLAASTFRWTVPFNTSTTAVTVNTGSVNLAPGSYGNVQVNGGTLVLGPGTYFIDSLTLQSGTNLTLNNASAPIFLYVRTTLAFRTRMTGTPENLMLVYFGAAGAAIEATFKGTLVAPNASLRIGVGGTPHVGALFAKSILVDPDVKLTQTAFARWDLVPFDVGVSPTLNCVVQLDPTTLGAVFGYSNSTGATITLGAGPHNFFSPGQADLGQPILFLPGQVPIASFQTFAAGSQLSLTIGQQAVTASASSPACPAALGAALTQLFVETADSRAVRQSIAGILSHPRFAPWVAAVRAGAGPQVSPFQSSMLDALDLIVANADLLADPATLTSAQQARLPPFRAALLANPAVVRLRLAGDALKGGAGAVACAAIAQIDGAQPARPFLPVQPDSLFAQTLALTSSTALAKLQTAMSGVATGGQSAALLGASGLSLAGLISENDLTKLQLAGPIPTGLFGAIFGGVVGGIVGFIGGGPGGAVAGAIAGAAIGGFTEDEIAKKNHKCDTGNDCFGGEICTGGFCVGFGGGISGSFLTGSACPNGETQCGSDGSCGPNARCAQGCCEDQTLIVSLCPGNTCSSDADCSGDNTCQTGCCAGLCGVNGTVCDEVGSVMCGIPDGLSACSGDQTCTSGCCQSPQPR
jgi:hypothetical protein